MTKKQIKEQLDILMLERLNDAIHCADLGNKYCANRYMTMASDVMLTASAFGVISVEEFRNINHTLSFSDIPY